VAGRPDQKLTPWGSFEEWSRLVCSAVVWAGMPDPGETQMLLQSSADVVAEHMPALLACWAQMDPARNGLTAAEVIDRLYKNPPSSAPPYHADMRDALEAMLGRPDAQRLGYKLRAYRRRLFEGRFIDRVGSHARAVRWSVLSADEFRRPETPPPEREREIE
jgi:hypothetical protein